MGSILFQLMFLKLATNAFITGASKFKYTNSFSTGLCRNLLIPLYINDEVI